MLRRDSGKSISFCDGFRKQNLFRTGAGLLPLLAVMLLAAPQLAFGQYSGSVTVNPRSLEFTETGSGTYTVQLDADPGTDTVTVTIVGGEDVVTVDPISRELELTSTNWEAGLTVTVTGVDDEDGVDDIVTLTHTATIGTGDDARELTLRNVSVSITVKDPDIQAVTISETTLDVVEAASATYTVRLATQPTAPVTVDIGGTSSEIAVSPSKLVFNPTGALGLWSALQTVTVFAGEDFDAEDDKVDLTHRVRGGDYTGVSANPIAVTVDDNDTRGVTVAPESLSIVAGASGTFSIVLTSEPTNTVRITVAETVDNFSVSPSSLSFSKSNWNRPQTVTVRVGSNFAIANSPVTLVNTINTSSSSRDKAYDTLDPGSPSTPDTAVADVSVTVSELASDVILSRRSMTIDEGKMAEYTVRLRREPDSGRTVTVAVIGAGFSVAPESLAFTEPSSPGETDGDWNEPKTVTVTATNDEDAVEETATITHSIGGIVPSGILQVRMDESDTRGVTVSTTSLEVTENGSARYSIVLDSQPVGDSSDRVTVTVGGASGDVTVVPSQLVFTGTDWFTAQEVEVFAALDDDGEPDPPVTLTHTVRGGDYERERADSVRVTVTEIHTRGIIVDPPSLPVGEGMTGMYSVRLESQPTGTVTVMVRGASGDVTVKPSRLIFTTSNWDEEQMVEVKAGQDDDGEPDPVVTLTHAASGGGYSGVISGMVTVTVTEDDIDRKAVRISPRSLTVTEGGAAESYTVVLTTEPTGTVAITLGGLAAARDQSLVVHPTSLRFTRGNWKIPQTVTVRAAEDDDAAGTAAGSPVRLTHTVNGGGYDDETPSAVEVTVRDNDSAAIIVSTPSLQMAQGTRRTYTVVLGSKPATATVSVAITGAPSEVTVSPAPLVFTQDNWSTPRRVTVHAAATAATGPETLAHTATDYTTANVALTIKSSSTPDVAINPTSLEITEGGSGSYTVVLTTEPSATVNVAIAGAAGDVSLRPPRLSFSTSNWNREQTVTVSVADDDDAVPDPAVTLTHSVTGADEYETATFTISTVSVTPKENDERGVTASSTSLTVAAGSSQTYMVGLTSEPQDSVTVTVNSESESVTVTGSPMVFTPDNWKTDQTITVNVAADAGKDTEQTVMLTHTVQGGDYSGLEGPTMAVTIPVEGAPGAPRSLTAQPGNQVASLTWTAPAKDGGSAILRYEVRHRESGGDYGAWATVPGEAGATSTVVRGLENGKSYEFQVRARNAIAAGEAATASATLVESAPAAPTGLTATGGDEQIQLSWNAPSAGGSQILRYEYRSRRSGGSWSDWETTSATSVTIGNLTNGDRYDFEVRAVNSVGEGAAAATSGTPGTPPSAPTGLTPRAEDEAIKVTWGMPADTGGSVVTRFEIRYRMSGGGWSNWLTVSGGSNATTYTFDDLTNGVAYDIQVRAVNAVGEGAAASVRATPMEGIDFAHFANGQAGGVTITSEIVLVNVENSTVTPAIYFYNQQGDMIDADSVVDVDGTEALAINGDGALTAPMGIAPRGEMTISTTGEGDLVVGSVRVFGTGRLGGVLRFDLPDVGVAGVGASEPVNDAIFPARRMARGINTGAAIRNLSSEPMTVTCMLMQGGEVMDTVTGVLPGDGHTSRFINEMFPGANTTDFVGSVRCTAPDGGMFVGVALELDAVNGIFTTLPVVPLGTGSGNGESMLNFAHFANGDFGGTATSSDLVFVNVANSAVSPAIYFYDQMGNMIDASMVVDEMMEGVEVSDGVLMVTTEIASMGERTISTSGMGNGMVGSVKVVSDGPIGGVLRFDIPTIGVAGVGASEAVNSAIFPARRMADGINTGAAIRNLESEMATVTCLLRSGGQRIGEAVINLAANGQNSEFINEMFPNANTNNFEGSVHCTAPSGMMFTGVALEMDFNNRIFTTLPVVPVR